MKEFEDMSKKEQEEIKELVIARLKTMSDNIKICIG